MTCNYVSSCSLRFTLDSTTITSLAAVVSRSMIHSRLYNHYVTNCSS